LLFPSTGSIARSSEPCFSPLSSFSSSAKAATRSRSPRHYDLRLLSASQDPRLLRRTRHARRRPRRCAFDQPSSHRRRPWVCLRRWSSSAHRRRHSQRAEEATAAAAARQCRGATRPRARHRGATRRRARPHARPPRREARRRAAERPRPRPPLARPPPPTPPRRRSFRTGRADALVAGSSARGGPRRRRRHPSRSMSQLPRRPWCTAHRRGRCIARRREL